MDDLVKQAMAKWPNVPSCFGWLGLDARGNWYMRDDSTQAVGSFNSGLQHAKGSRLQHDKLIAFIERNYASDKEGRWYFQNGPQRVFVELEATPWIWRISTDFKIYSHTQMVAKYQSLLQDENGLAYLVTDKGFGLIHTQDVGLASAAIDSGLWTMQHCLNKSLALQFNFCKSPQIQEHLNHK